MSLALVRRGFPANGTSQIAKEASEPLTALVQDREQKVYPGADCDRLDCHAVGVSLVAHGAIGAGTYIRYGFSMTSSLVLSQCRRVVPRATAFHLWVDPGGKASIRRSTKSVR